MPTYEYRCPSGHTFDLFQKMSDEPRASCPECGAESERVISGGAGFLFKGEGFYITDYRSEDYKKAASKESAPQAETGSGDSDSGAKTATPAASSGPDAGTGTKKKAKEAAPSPKPSSDEKG